MGVDVVGNNPDSAKGEHFYNRYVWWGPLAAYIVTTHPDIAAQCEYWGSNNGDGLDGRQSKTLAKLLRDDIDSGRADRYAEAFEARIAGLAPEHCQACDGTGVRCDEIGLADNMAQRELAAVVQVLTGRSHGWCNRCDGVGVHASWESQTQFSVDNLTRFATFLEHCGGFTIC